MQQCHSSSLKECQTFSILPEHKKLQLTTAVCQFLYPLLKSSDFETMVSLDRIYIIDSFGCIVLRALNIAIAVINPNEILLQSKNVSR